MEALHCKTNFLGHYPTTTNNNRLSGKFCDVLPELNNNNNNNNNTNTNTNINTNSNNNDNNNVNSRNNNNSDI